MALEMKVYREIRGYEAKVIAGMSWRQLGSMALGVPVGSGIFAALAITLHNSGWSWERATNWALYAMFIALVPFAAWGWWRPKSLKPEQYIGYLFRHLTERKVIFYDDTYRPDGSAGGRADGNRRKDPRRPAERSGSRTEERRKRKARKAVPQEHSPRPPIFERLRRRRPGEEQAG